VDENWITLSSDETDCESITFSLFITFPIPDHVDILSTVGIVVEKCEEAFILSLFIILLLLVSLSGESALFDELG